MHPRIIRTIARKASGVCRVVIDANGDRHVTKERDKPEDAGIGRKERGVSPDQGRLCCRSSGHTR